MDIPQRDDASADDPDFDLPTSMFRSGEAPEPATIKMHRFKDNIGPVNVDVYFTKDTQPDGVKVKSRIEGGDNEYVTVNDLALFEGDIVLGPADEARGSRDPGAKSIVITDERFRWPGGRVRYAVHGDAGLADTVDKAIKHWESKTPFRFESGQWTDQDDHISFERHSGCWSHVGRQGGKQVISIGSSCSVGSAIHEIGHALGLWHEQSREDRDAHIEIVWENIQDQYRHNFDKHVLDGDDLGPYDQGSIMHYPATAFSKNGQPTIRAKNGQPIGQRTGLSNGDLAGLRLAYKKENLNW